MAQQVAYPQAEPYCTSAADAMTCVESYQQTQLYRALEAQAKAAAVAAKMTEVRQRKEKAKMADNDIIPDISLARVFKWAVVLIVVMFLGKRVWDMFGDKVTAQLHKALGDNKPAA